MKSVYNPVHRIILSVLICVLFNSTRCNLIKKKEETITTSSREALNLFLEGREKWENLEIAEAARLFEKAIEIDSNFALAYLYRSQSGGGFDIFRQNIQKAASLVDEVSEVEKHWILYIQASADGEEMKQREHLDELLKLFPEDKRVQTLAGYHFQYVLYDNKVAIEHYKKAIDLDKNYAPAYNALGYAQFSLGNYEAAEIAFKTYINLIPDRPNPYDSYAALLLKMGKYDESIEQYKNAFLKDSSFTSALEGLGHNYVFKGNYEKAREYYQKIFDKTHNIDKKFGALFWKATSYVHEGYIGKAMKAFEEYRALAKKEEHVINVILSYANQGFILTESTNPARGMDYYEKASDLVKSSDLSKPVKDNYILNSLMWRCYVLTAKNEFDKAEDDFEKCKQMVENRQNQSEERDLYFLYAFREIKKGNYERAIDFLFNADMADPYNWYYMAVAYDKMGDEVNALKFYNRVADCNVNSLGLALVQKKSKIKIKE
jgi:tetratricopeptide (TPR) repeat protein